MAGAGEISTGALLFVEYKAEADAGRTEWRLMVQPRPAIESLTGAMGKLVLADGGEAIGRQAEGGRKLFNGSKTHRLWYADVGREAKREIVVNTMSGS